MFGSLKLGKFFGIDLYIHSTFWLLPLFVFFSGAISDDPFGAFFEVLVLFGVFGCIALHEVGHAMAARAYGIGTRDITLYPFGGIASLERMPERPEREIAIALAGPAVNFAIVLGIIAAAVIGNLAFPLAWETREVSLGEVYLSRILIANLFLGLFNLIPAFPMDGGRVLRAVLSFGMDRVAATRAAVNVGSVLAIFAGFYGLIEGPFSLVLVAFVVFFLGRAELLAVQAAEARKNWQRWYYGEVLNRGGHNPDPRTGAEPDHQPVVRVYYDPRSNSRVGHPE